MTKKSPHVDVFIFVGFNLFLINVTALITIQLQEGPPNFRLGYLYENLGGS